MSFVIPIGLPVIILLKYLVKKNIMIESLSLLPYNFDNFFFLLSNILTLVPYNDVKEKSANGAVFFLTIFRDRSIHGFKLIHR